MLDRRSLLIRWIFGSRPRARGLKYHPIHGIYKLMDAWVV